MIRSGQYFACGRCVGSKIWLVGTGHGNWTRGRLWFVETRLSTEVYLSRLADIKVIISTPEPVLGKIISTAILIKVKMISDILILKSKATRSSAIAEEPRDALRQLKYYGRF